MSLHEFVKARVALLAERKAIPALWRQYRFYETDKLSNEGVLLYLVRKVIYSDKPSTNLRIIFAVCRSQKNYEHRYVSHLFQS